MKQGACLFYCFCARVQCYFTMRDSGALRKRNAARYAALAQGDAQGDAQAHYSKLRQNARKNHAAESRANLTTFSRNRRSTAPLSFSTP